MNCFPESFQTCLNLGLAAILSAGALAACGTPSEAARDEVTLETRPAEDTSAAGDARSAASSTEACPFSEDPDTTLEPDDLPLRFTFRYPESWEITNRTTLHGGMARLTMRRAFEVDGSRRSLALELVQNGGTSSRNAIEQMTRGGGQFFNQEQEEITLGGETIRIGKTLTTTKVMYSFGVPGDGGYHLTQLHMHWAGDLCQEEVLRLGREMLDTFVLR